MTARGAVRHLREDVRLAHRAQRRRLVLEVVGAAVAVGEVVVLGRVGGLAAREDDDGLVGADERAGEVGVEVAGLEVEDVERLERSRVPVPPAGMPLANGPPGMTRAVVCTVDVGVGPSSR